MTLTPTGPETTRLTAAWFFAQATLDQPGFSAADVASFVLIVMGQDFAVAEINQRGLKSPKFTRGRLMPQESGIHNFHKWVMRQVTSAACPVGPMPRKLSSNWNDRAEKRRDRDMQLAYQANQ